MSLVNEARGLIKSAQSNTIGGIGDNLKRKARNYIAKNYGGKVDPGVKYKAAKAASKKMSKAMLRKATAKGAAAGAAAGVAGTVLASRARNRKD